VEADIEAELDTAMEFAFSSSFPSVAELRKDVFEAELPA